jgi:hypothetical protein
MKHLIMGLALLTSSVAFAEIGMDYSKYVPKAKVGQDKEPAYVKECRLPGMKKLRDKLKRVHHAELDRNSFDVFDVRDESYSPVKYVWFTAEGINRDGDRILEMVRTKKTFSSFLTESEKCN